MIEVELTGPELVTVGYTGVPGQRTFYLQAKGEQERVTLLMEKEQVVGIAELLSQLLARLGDAPAAEWDRAALGLRMPLEPRWRVGEISVGLDPTTDQFVLELGELVEDEAEPREVRLWLDLDQARRLAAHAAEILGQGRPTCQLCGRPTEPDGAHVCPASNGHGRLGR